MLVIKTIHGLGSIVETFEGNMLIANCNVFVDENMVSQLKDIKIVSSVIKLKDSIYSEDTIDGKKPEFKANKCEMVGRNAPLDVSKFARDLEAVFLKHGITSIRDGFVGFTPDGRFAITNCHIKSENKGVTF